MAAASHVTPQLSTAEEDSTKIFTSEGGFVKALIDSHSASKEELSETDIVESGKRIRSKSISTINALAKHTEMAKKKASFPHVYLITQRSTWSRLGISRELMQYLIAEHELSDQIFDILHAFKARVRDVQHLRWSSCAFTNTSYTDIAPGLSIAQGKARHFWYRIQYPVPVDRDSKNSFSIRQTAVYQVRFDSGKPDVWILIRPTAAVQQRFVADLERDTDGKSHGDPMLCHLNFLSSTTAFWDDYVEYLRLYLNKYSESGCFSRVASSFKFTESDYSVTFKDCQDLERLQWKYTRLVACLEGNVDAVQTCKDLCEQTATSVELARISRQLSFYRGRILDLSERCRETVGSLQRILDFRHTAEAHALSKRMHDALVAIDVSQVKSTATLDALAQQTQALASLQQARDKDSKKVKALTAMSTLYLPASLVATIFSQNLVQLLPDGRFAPARQSWIALVSAVVLIVVTFVGVTLLENLYRWTRPKLLCWPF